MSFSSLSRLLSHSITPKPFKTSTLCFATTSLAEKLYTHLENNPTNLENSFNSIKPIQLSSKCVDEVLKRCSVANPKLGLRFFVWGGCYRSDYRHSSYMYGKACDFLKIRENPSFVFDLFEVYRMENCVVSVKMFKIVLNLFREGGLANEALLVLRKMPEFDVRPDTNAYNVVIRLFCEKGDLDMARSLMAEMGLISLYPDMVTYVSMIRGFCDAGKLGEASGMLKMMREHGCVPNVVAYTALLNGFCRFGSVESVMELLQEMEKEGGDCSPNVVTYTTVIQSFYQKGRITDALGVLDRMEAYGCLPNRVTVSILIKGLCNNGRVDEAYRLIDRVVALGSVSYSDCYSSLVVCLIRNRKVEEAEKLFKKVLDSGVKLDSLACSSLIKALYLEKRMLDAFYLFDDIEKIGCSSTIDYDIYSMLLLGLCQQSHLDQAAKLARIMLEKRIHLIASYTEKIIENLKNYGDKDLVNELTSLRSS